MVYISFTMHIAYHTPMLMLQASLRGSLILYTQSRPPCELLTGPWGRTSHRDCMILGCVPPQSVPLVLSWGQALCNAHTTRCSSYSALREEEKHFLRYAFHYKEIIINMLLSNRETHQLVQSLVTGSIASTSLDISSAVFVKKIP